jgi:hypothetical protein
MGFLLIVLFIITAVCFALAALNLNPSRQVHLVAAGLLFLTIALSLILAPDMSTLLLHHKYGR